MTQGIVLPVELRVQLPLPPTANHIWQIFGNRMHITTTYRKWLKAAVEAIREEVPEEFTFAGLVEIEISVRLGKGFPKNRDLDNCIKPAIDVLKPAKFGRTDGKLKSDGAAVIADDSSEYVARILAGFLPPHDSKSEAEFFIAVRPWSGSLTAPKAVRAKREVA